MPWTPTQPPAHTGPTTTYSGVFPWDDFRFVLVKLDNTTMQMVKPRWGCPHAQNSMLNQATRYNGAASGNGTEGYGVGAGTIGGNCGGSSPYNVAWTGTNHGTGSGNNCPSGGYPPGGIGTGFFPTATTMIEARACIPWRSGSSGITMNNPWSNATNADGFSTMAKCVRGHESGSYNGAYDSHCHACRPNQCTSSCLQAYYHATQQAGLGLTGGGAHGSYWSGSGTVYTPNNGKGPYNDSLSYLQFFTSGPEDPGIGIGSLNVFSSSGTMWDISQDGGMYPDDLSECWQQASNLIYPESPEIWFPGKYRPMDLSSYYAIIMIPSNTAQRDDSSWISNYSFKLHQDIEGDAWKKLLGENWTKTAHAWDGQSPELVTVDPYSIGYDGIDQTNGNYPADFDGRLARSNTGIQHNLSNNNIMAIGLSGKDYTLSANFGGIMDGEFLPIDHNWFKGVGAGANPWGMEILNDVQRHMIKESIHQRLDPTLQTAYNDRDAYVLVTKTPASATSWQGFINTGGMFGDQPEEDDSGLYFDLHITKGPDTVMIPGVATGYQDKALEMDHGDNASYTDLPEAGLGKYQGLDGMTLSAECISDWGPGPIQYWWNASSVTDIHVHTLQTAGFDSVLRNEPQHGNTTLGDYNNVWGGNYATANASTVVSFGAFYNFDGRTFGDSWDWRGGSPTSWRRYVQSSSSAKPTNVGAVYDHKIYWFVGGQTKTICSLQGGHGNYPGGYDNAHTWGGGKGYTDHDFLITYHGVLEGMDGVAFGPYTNVQNVPKVAFKDSSSSTTHGTAFISTSHVAPDTHAYGWPNQGQGAGTSNIQWKSLNGDGSSFRGNAKFLNTNHPNVANANRWGIRTGHGLFYHSNITPPVCPTVVTTTWTGFGCGQIPVFEITWTNGGTFTWYDFELEVNGVVVYTQTGNISNGSGSYTLSGLSDLDIINWSIQGEPWCLLDSGSFQINTMGGSPLANGVTHSIDGAITNITDPTSCSATDGIVSYESSGQNQQMFPALQENGFISWTLFDSSNTSIDQGSPFTAPTANITNPTGYGANAVANINSFMSSYSGADVLVSGSGLGIGTYTLCQASGQSVYNAAMTVSGTDLSTWLATYQNIGCIACQTFTLGCVASSLDVVSVYTQCNSADSASSDGVAGSSVGSTVYMDAAEGASTLGYINGAQTTEVGQVTANVTGGSAPFTYLWSTGDTTQEVNFLAPGTYSVTVTDAAGVVLTGSTTISAPTALSWGTAPVATSATCGSGTGSVSGGVATLGTHLTNPNPGGTAAGSATPWVCGGLEYAITQTNGEVWEPTTTEWVVWEDAANTILATWQPSSSFAALAPGTYYLWARNECGCAIVSGALVISAGTALSATVAIVNPGCGAPGSSVITVTPSGTAPYIYTWTTVNTGTNGVAEPGFVAPITNAYTQGTGGAYDYEVVVTDSAGCTTLLTASTSIAAPMNVTAVVNSIGCAGGSGSITTTVTGGTAGYTYQWSGGSTATTANLTGLAVGTYTLVVTDSASPACTTTASWVITNLGGSEVFIDLNHHEYNTTYTLATSGTAAEDLLEGMYGGPTCPSSDDGTIRIILDSSTPGGNFPYAIYASTVSNVGPWTQVTDNGGTNLSMINVSSYDTTTDIIANTGLVYDPSNVLANSYFEINNTQKMAGTTLALTAGSTWHFKLVEAGGVCEAFFTTTILPSDYINVDVGGNIPTIVTQPSCCDCSSYGASLGTNVCNGAFDISPTMGTYEDHTNINYSYLWTYASLPATCAVPGHNNTNTMWANQTTQDIGQVVGEWPGTYTVVVTDSCSGTDTETTDLIDPIVYIDDITWSHPLCADCCDATMTVTCHGGNNSLEISFDNGVTFNSVPTGTTTFYGKQHPLNNFPTYGFDGCAGIQSIWVKDGSGCAVEYFQDPDDSMFLASYDDNCHSDFNASLLLTTSGTFVPTFNSSVMTTPTAGAFTGVNSTKIQLIAVSDFTSAQACVLSHNIFPGDTAGHIKLALTGGNPPYSISVTALAGPVYNPVTGMIPCAGIGPLSPLVPSCSLTGGIPPGINLAATNVWTIEESNLVPGVWTDFDATNPYVSNDTFFDIQQVSVSRDLGASFLGAEYLFHVQDSTGCVQQTQVGMDNGIFGIISVYGAENCDCVCPIGFVLDIDPTSTTYEECISEIVDPICYNGTYGEWTLAKNLYAGQVVPGAWAVNGAQLYGVWTGLIVDYSQSITLNMSTLPLTKDISGGVTAPNHLMNDNTGTPILGADIGTWFVNPGSALFSRVDEIAIWLDQVPVPITLPALPTGQWLGIMTEINFTTAMHCVIGLACDEKMRMKVDGTPWLELDGDNTVPPTVTSNFQQFNLFPIILPIGLHVIEFEVFSTLGDAFMAWEIYPNTISTGNLFVAEAPLPSFTPGLLAANILLDANGNPLSSSYYHGEEIHTGSGNYGYSCCGTAGSVPSMYMGQYFCTTDVTAPCEVPLDCGRCVDSNGAPVDCDTEKGPCEANGNTWITDDSKLADLVECPGTYANIAYSRIQGALASNVLDIRCVWLIIMIKHMLKNLNICFTLNDIQDVFTGFLDHVCPTCAQGKQFTPAEMEAITNIFLTNNNSNFDF